MPFGDFYKKSEQGEYDHAKSVVATFALLAVVVVSVIGLFYTVSNKIGEYLEKSALGKSVVQTCSALPKPEQFDFVGAGNPYIDENAAEVVYRYQTEREPAEITPFFFIWFEAGDWARPFNNELIFIKGRRTISIKSDDNFPRQYEIRCSEKQEIISF